MATTTNPLGAYTMPAVGFDLPLQLLAACHRRVEQQCATLRRLVAHLAAHGADAQARNAAAAVMRYFDTSARHHHADEEVDLFPALLESMAGSDAVCLRELTAALCAEHRQLELRWADLRRTLDAVARGEAAVLSSAAVEGFVELYAGHIAREEDELLPMAERLLLDGELERIGLAMHARREAQGGDSPDPPNPSGEPSRSTPRT